MIPQWVHFNKSVPWGKEACRPTESASSHWVTGRGSVDVAALQGCRSSLLGWAHSGYQIEWTKRFIRGSLLHYSFPYTQHPGQCLFIHATLGTWVQVLSFCSSGHKKRALKAKLEFPEETYAEVRGKPCCAGFQSQRNLCWSPHFFLCMSRSTDNFCPVPPLPRNLHTAFCDADGGSL